MVGRSARVGPDNEGQGTEEIRNSIIWTNRKEKKEIEKNGSDPSIPMSRDAGGYATRGYTARTGKPPERAGGESVPTRTTAVASLLTTGPATKGNPANAGGSPRCDSRADCRSGRDHTPGCHPARQDRCGCQLRWRRDWRPAGRRRGLRSGVGRVGAGWSRSGERAPSCSRSRTPHPLTAAAPGQHPWPRSSTSRARGRDARTRP